MALYLKGQKLNQQQCDALVPVLNQHMLGKISKKKFEQACIDALKLAGCPIKED